MKRKARLPRDRVVPPSERPGMRLTEIDLAFLQAVGTFRLLTARQLEALFEREKSTIQYRMQRLFQHEYVGRQYLPIASLPPAAAVALYTLKRRGFHALTAAGYDTEDIVLPKDPPSWQTIEHTYALSTLRVAFIIGARLNGWTVEVWEDELLFRRRPDMVMVKDRGGRTQEKPVYPDGYFCLANLPVGREGKARFFLEVDRGTERHKAVAPQIAVYEAYTRGGGYTARYKSTSLRILIVAPSLTRLNNLKATVKESGGDGKYWFTTLPQVTPETILTAPIWQRLEWEGFYPLVSAL